MPKISELPSQSAASAAHTDIIPVVGGGTTQSIPRSALPLTHVLFGHSWRPSPAIGSELWTLANMQAGASYNNTTITPSLTANSTAQTSRTRINLGNLANRDQAFRVKFTIASLPSTSGWATLDMRLTDASGTLLAGTDAQVVSNNNSLACDYVFEFNPNVASVTGTVMFEIQLNVYNNCPSGVLQITNVSLREIAYVTRPLFFCTNAFVSGPEVFTQLLSPRRKVYKVFEHQLASESTLLRALSTGNGYTDDRPWQFDPPDPTFVSTSIGVSTPSSRPVLGATQDVRAIRILNNDQIMQVLKQDGTTYELRGNVHGGETERTTAAPNRAYAYDLLGDGNWTSIIEPFGDYLRPAHRFKWTWNTQIARSAPDSDVIANVDHTTTFFNDGMIRTDRTTSFTKALTLAVFFEWMTTHDNSTPMVGRTGRGLAVLGEVDTYAKLAAPAAPTAATATTGGTLTAATYRYYLTALTEGGETLPSAFVTQATTGSTSTVTVSWSTITGATAYRVYGRANATGSAVLLATLNKSATSWIDDGSLPACGQQPPTVNTARRLDLTDTTSTDFDNVGHAYAHWTVWREPVTGICHGMIWDRDAALARTGIAAVRTKHEKGSGIHKSYAILVYANGADTIAVNASTVWTATHWLYTYCPASETDYHTEIALKASDLAALKALYPAS